MRVKMKEQRDDDLKRLADSVKESTKKNPAHIELRKDRVAELPEHTQDRLAEIFAAQPATPVIKDGGDGQGLGIFYNDDSELGILALISAFGTPYGGNFIVEQLNCLIQATGAKNDSAGAIADKVTSAIGVVAALEPKDAVESMLASQMTATHSAIMKSAMQLNQAETIEQSNSAANRMTKLMNVYTRQVETLNKHRGKGQQKMTVEHVHVSEGGQAIIGTVEGGGGGNSKKGGQPHALRSED